MDAREWLMQEFEINEYSAEHHAFLTLFETSIPLMERYANYKTKELQAQILNFRNIIKNDLSVDEGGVVTIYKGHNDNLELLDAYDKHFNLTTKRYKELNLDI